MAPSTRKCKHILFFKVFQLGILIQGEYQFGLKSVFQVHITGDCNIHIYTANLLVPSSKLVLKNLVHFWMVCVCVLCVCDHIQACIFYFNCSKISNAYTLWDQVIFLQITTVYILIVSIWMWGAYSAYSIITVNRRTKCFTLMDSKGYGRPVHFWHRHNSPSFKRSQ